MAPKTSYPEEIADILKELKKGKVKKGDLATMFTDKHADYNLDQMAKHGLIKRSYVNEDGVDKIQLEWSGKNVNFGQGQRNYPKPRGKKF